jgi:hypothetical protein
MSERRVEAQHKRNWGGKSWTHLFEPALPTQTFIGVLVFALLEAAGAMLGDDVNERSLHIAWTRASAKTNRDC